MEKFQYFHVMDDGSKTAYLESKDGKVVVQTEYGTRLLDFDRYFYSKKLKELVERLDVNHLIKFKQVEFLDSKYKDKEYYVLEQLPIINCYNLDKCKKVKFRFEGYVFSKEIQSQEEFELVNNELSGMPKLSYAHLGDDYKLVYERALKTVIFEPFLSSELLEEYKAPLFYVTSDDFLCCTAAFVKECRKQGISGMWWKGLPSDLPGGEPDGFIEGSSPTIKKQSVEYEEVRAFIVDFTKWLTEIAQTEAFQKYKSILFGLFESGQGMRVYTAGATHKRFGWEEDCDEPLSYLPQSLKNKTSTEALFFVNEAIVENEALLKGKKVLFGFDDGDVYKAKKFKK